MGGGRRYLKRGEFICNEGDAPAGLYLLLDGWAASSLTFASGARQLLKIHLPGDMIGMPSLALQQAGDSVVALTQVELSVISRQSLGQLFERSPRLAAILFLISQEERVAGMDRLASIGATEAVHSLAALLLHIHDRVRRSDPDIGDSFDMPLSQDDIADLIGITTVHLNRTLQHMRGDGLLAWTRHRVTILKRGALHDLAGLPARILDRDADWLPRSSDRRER